MIKNIADLEEKIAQAIRKGEPLSEIILQEGLDLDVCLLHKSGRKIRRNAAVRNWDPLDGVVSITFRESTSQPAPVENAPEGDEAAPLTQEVNPAQEVVRALNEAEGDPALKFVSLKWFRDKYLPEQVGGWASDRETRQRAIVEAIERGWMLPGKVPNPKNPTFPVTSIRLNRPRPDVQKILGSHQESRTFSPVPIRGESLSSTVIADRR